LALPHKDSSSSSDYLTGGLLESAYAPKVRKTSGCFIFKCWFRLPYEL